MKVRRVQESLILFLICSILIGAISLGLHSKVRAQYQPSNVTQLLIDGYTGIFSAVANGAQVPLQFKQTLQGSAYTNATTSFTNVVGTSGPAWQWNIDANQIENGECFITWQGSANTAGPKFQLTGPANPTAVVLNLESPVTTTTTITPAAAVAFTSAVANTGTVTTSTNFLATLSFAIVNGLTAGTINVQAAANGTGTLTIEPGSYCKVQ